MITVIDFPQVVKISRNPDAHFILKRDITRICDYFSTQGVDCETETIFADLWDEYGHELEIEPPE